MDRTRSPADGWRHVAVACLIAGPLLAVGVAVHAQSAVGVIAGRVTDARTALPAAGALVAVEGTSLSGLAGNDGRYRIANVPPGSHTVTVRLVGFSATSQAVRVVADATVSADFTLQATAIPLEEILVTGTAGGAKLRAIGNSVAKINAVEAVALGAPLNLTSLLNARAPGLVVNHATGRLGAGGSINIRGRSSLSLGDAPLIYVDGVRVNSATSTGPVGGGGLAQQGSAVASRLNDINPDDIESIEVIKGPAAATIYGTEASSGVIQIITKKGVAGPKPVFTLQLQQGALWFRNAEERVPTNYMRDESGNIVTWNAVKVQDSIGTPLFKTGQTRLAVGSVSGGFDQARYYLSASYEDDDGVEPNNELQQVSLHANVGVTPSERLDLSTSLHYVKLDSRLGTDFGASALLGAVGGHALLFPRSRGYFAVPPEVTWELWDNTQDVTRFTASGTVNHRPTGWLSQRLLMGVDYTGEDSRVLERFATPELAQYLAPTAATGRIAQTLRHSTRLTVDYGASGRAAVTPALAATTSVGLQVFRTEADSSSLGGIGFPGVGVETVSAVGTPFTPAQSEVVNTTVGGYAQEQFAWRDRLFLTAALRVDNNSAFGEDFKWVAYPKADVSWVISEEPFWSARDVVNTLRLRAAYGESGRSPSSFSALRLFNPVQGPGGSNAVTPASQGNPDLKPERGRELEVGFETELLRRLTVDFTYYSKRTDDLIVNQAVAPSSGFPGTVPRNLGRVDNSGVELQATLRALQMPNVQWTIAGSLATNKDEIKELGFQPGEITSPGAANRVGYPIGGIFVRRIASADRDPTTGLATNVLCDGGPGNAPMPCVSAPFLFIGTTTPKQSGSLANTVTLHKRLRFYGLIDFQRGNILFNANDLLRCVGGFGAPLCHANHYPEQYDVKFLATASIVGLQQGLFEPFYQDASYFKLRELSATYDLPEKWVPGVSGASLTLAAHELAMWTDYEGIDPDFSGANEQARLPQLSRLTAILNIRF
jgi:TonB-linked SusC/RagA family outer membrane protein